MSSDQYVSRKEFALWARLWEAEEWAEHKKFLQLMAEQRDRRTVESTPPPPPPKPKLPPSLPDISSNSYADFIYQGQGLLNRLDKEDEEDSRGTVVRRRSSAIKRKGSNYLVDSYGSD